MHKEGVAVVEVRLAVRGPAEVDDRLPVGVRFKRLAELREVSDSAEGHELSVHDGGKPPRIFVGGVSVSVRFPIGAGGGGLVDGEAHGRSSFRVV